MSFWFLLQILVNLILLAGVVGLWIRLQRPPKDDPRLSKGLQLLQSKIAILEDLSDRTETQVNQLTSLLEQKVKDIQNKIQSADKQLARIDQSMEKSLEVAKIFQDRIPHEEILERQNTIKYVKAARMAHQGMGVEEIAAECPELSRGEIEFIAKVNRDQLMFCEESLPEWANTEIPEEEFSVSSLNEMGETKFSAPLQREGTDYSAVFEVPKTDQEALKKLGDAFKAACNEVKEQDEAAQQTANNVSALFSVTQNIAQNFLGEKPVAATPTAAPIAKTKPLNSNKEGVVRPVAFRRIDMTKDLE
ncbi:hypothetical protein AZI86_09520 [Bdellovibrio bacteriovorus]|uniref:DUF2802 domain-containing protein n=1 Tax=Bdellovibrio bacteriovorus TaxID=959 RepID=A0A150WSD4_BDEBC|nr:DUF2802 domain-containing protein [Bdellovibrio bacteriovorus]KYG67234.1 hypothetical protein AZI86_09520 [Bdellovibrio bacteriovorus]